MAKTGTGSPPGGLIHLPACATSGDMGGGGGGGCKRTMDVQLWVRFTQVGSVTMSTAGRGPGHLFSAVAAAAGGAGHLFITRRQRNNIISAFNSRTPAHSTQPNVPPSPMELGCSTACEPQRGRPTYSRDNLYIYQALNLPRADWGK